MADVFGLSLARVLSLRGSQIDCEMNLNSSFPRLPQRFFLAVGVVVLAYVCTALAYAELYQSSASWKFAHKVGKIRVTKEAVVAAEPIDLKEGDVIGKLDISRIRVSVMVLQ